MSNAVMYGTYNGIKQTLASDDIAGIQSIYGTRQFDQFNNGSTRDNAPYTATNLNSQIGSNAQIAIPGLDITTPGDSEWFYVNVPSTTNGTMTVTVQSSNLSSLSPDVQVYNSSLSLVGQASAPNSMGATISVTDSSVASGQGYYIKVLAATGYGGLGGYGLLVNFGSQAQSPIPPPNTVVPSEPSEAGGTSNDNAPSGGSGPLQGILTTIGDLTDWVVQYTANPLLSQVTSTVHSTVTTVAAAVTIGTDSTRRATTQANVQTTVVTVASSVAITDDAGDSRRRAGPRPPGRR